MSLQERKTETIEYFIGCDICGATTRRAAYGSIGYAASLAQEEGWQVGDRDICPTCLDKAASEAVHG